MLLYIFGALLIIAIWGSYRNKAKEGMVEQSYTKMAGTGFSTPSLQSLTAPNQKADDCMTACNADTDCKGFSFVEGKGCELKSSMDLAFSESIPSIDSYLKSEASAVSEVAMAPFVPTLTPETTATATPTTVPTTIPTTVPTTPAATVVASSMFNDRPVPSAFAQQNAVLQNALAQKNAADQQNAAVQSALAQKNAALQNAMAQKNAADQQNAAVQSALAQQSATPQSATPQSTVAQTSMVPQSTVAQTTVQTDGSHILAANEW